MVRRLIHYSGCVADPVKAECTTHAVERFAEMIVQQGLYIWKFVLISSFVLSHLQMEMTAS